MTADEMDKLQFDGGCIAFDFTNTVNTRKHSAYKDYINSFQNLLLWSEKVKLLDADRLAAIHEIVDSASGTKAFEYAIYAREVLHGIFAPIANNNTPQPAIIEKFNGLISRSLCHAKFETEDFPNSLSFHQNNAFADEIIDTIVKSAFDVLTSENFKDKIKECPGCGWLFLDKSKNGKRRWCDMQACGSNDKALRYYHKNKLNAKSST